MLAFASMDQFQEDREGAFIHACLSAYLYHDSTRLPRESNLDWEKFYQLLIQNKLVGLFSILGRTYPDLWPTAIKKRLREDRYRQIPYYDWCQQKVVEILSILHDQGIPVIVLKGWGLVPVVFGGDPSQRPASDIDLLIRPQDIARTIDKLHELHYTDGALEPWHGYFRRFLNSAHYLSSQMYPTSAQFFNIDLHWGFPEAPFYDRRINVEEFFERAQKLSLVGIEVNSLSVEDNLIYTSTHMAHHGYIEILSRYYEIAALILQENRKISWEKIINTASTWRVTIPLKRMITTFNRLWPGIIPLDVIEHLERLRPSPGERFINWCLSHSTRSEAVIIILSCLNTPGLIWKLRFTLETAFPGPTYLNHYFGPAPGNLWPLLYITRFFRFVKG